MQQIIERVRQELQESTDPKTQANGQRFFKEKIRFYGVKVPQVHRIARTWFHELRGNSKKEIFGLCDMLWKSGYMEESFVACDWSYELHEQYEPDDIAVFERWILNDVNNWASCDTLCNHSVGAWLEMYPDGVKRLPAWAASENRWMKRAAAVSLILPARQGLFLETVFGLADQLSGDPDDLVQKGYGWMLKAASEAHPREVFDYVNARKATMPRTALRYAIEKMPAAWRQEAMAK